MPCLECLPSSRKSSATPSFLPHVPQAEFPAQLSAVPLDAFYRAINKVRNSLIRTDADEVTYPAHIILRFEIERALIEGEIEADDIPALWDEKMQTLLGLDTRGNYRDGCMQDAHWTEGAFGYFPSYTLGAMYAAQWFAAMRRAVPDLDPLDHRGAGLRIG